MYTRDTDKKLKKSILATFALLGFLGLSGYFGFHSRVTDVGYRPDQPIPFSHKLHAGDNGIKCQYCHNTVERSAHSAVPSTSTCMNCHIAVKSESPKIAKVKESWETNTPIEWRRIHKVPDYVNFNHAAHIRSQIDCASCHGEVETMGVVAQMKPLSMGWCLDCHRNPQEYVVPAREISGIFTGTDDYTTVANRIKTEQPSWGDGKWMPIRDAAIEGIGASIHEMKPAVANFPNPKKLALGPENCSSCHY
jgi:menaquinone reductase, multiheme cytochrome c subunit